MCLGGIAVKRFASFRHAINFKILDIMTQEEKIKRRNDDNRFLRHLVELHQTVFPELRYIQSLWSLGIIDKQESEVADRFYEEPYDTIIRIMPYIESLLHIVGNMQNKNISVKLMTINIREYLNKNEF